MKKIFLLFLVIGISAKSVGQDKAQEKVQETGEKKEASRLTFGIGIGVNHLFDNVYDYSLSTDSNNNLEITKLNRNSIVVSPVVVFRLRKSEIIKKGGKIEFFYNSIIKNKDGTKPLDGEEKDEKLPEDDLSRFSILLSTDLINIQGDKVSYNKRIDGGMGIGYSFSPDLMVGLFYEIKSYRQLREYVVEQYENKPIPNGAGFYNALDETNNNLYYNKQLEGLSLKLIFNFNTL
jgi:hypothetical protein